MRESAMPSGNVTRSIGAVIDQDKQEDPMSFAAVMVQVDVEHDSEGRVELAIGLADRFQAALIGVAGCALWPAFMAGDVELSKSNQYDFQKMMARFEQRGKSFAPGGARSRRSSGVAPLNLPASFSCVKRGRRISSSSAAGAANTTPTPALSCCGPGGPFCWCLTPPLRCRFAAWSLLG